MDVYDSLKQDKFIVLSDISRAKTRERVYAIVHEQGRK